MIYQMFSLSVAFFPPVFNYCKKVAPVASEKNCIDNFQKQGVLSVNDYVAYLEVNGFNPECFLALTSTRRSLGMRISCSIVDSVVQICDLE